MDILLDPAAGDPHNYQLTPGDVTGLQRADVVVLNGLGLEEFLAGALSDLPPGTFVVTATESVDPLIYHSAEGRHEGHHHDRWDPHAWLSPKEAVRMTENIRDALAQVDPDHAEVYRANAAEFIERLEEVYAEMLEAAEGWRNRTIITNHDAFAYLARDLGLEIAGVVMPTPGASPSAGEMLELVEAVRESRAAAVFVEPQYPEGPARRIAEEAGVPVYTLDPCVTGRTNLGYFIEVMERNLANLNAALGE